MPLPKPEVGKKNQQDDRIDRHRRGQRETTSGCSQRRKSQPTETTRVAATGTPCKHEKMAGGNIDHGASRWGAWRGGILGWLGSLGRICVRQGHKGSGGRVRDANPDGGGGSVYRPGCIPAPCDSAFLACTGACPCVPCFPCVHGCAGVAGVGAGVSWRPSGRCRAACCRAVPQLAAAVRGRGVRCTLRPLPYNQLRRRTNGRRRPLAAW